MGRTRRPRYGDDSSRAIAFSMNAWFTTALAFGALMSVASLVKLMALAGVLAMILWGTLSRAPPA